ncbi:hypothetical protein BD410DRAFT_135744 [Rickenella mellea]|uniref:Uncharacterized protein n=1 Tax=Rickenella mellea TaxID=50990 RepID=A0A4Y7PKX9_9AGAM|nr:hypothetical protein BD410DRAFT_135744 [Rickenella mellea]
MTLFVNAVRVMERLVDLRIAFSCQSGSYELDSWRALWKCLINRRRLRRLEIKVIPTEVFAGIDHLDFLHDLKVTVFHFGHDEYNKLATFISRNVKLKVLDIKCIPPHNTTIWDLIDSSLFPDLKSLILESQSHHGLLDHGPSPLMFFDFMRLHQTLETFQTRKIHLPIVQSDPGSLPSLAVLYNNVSSDAVIAMLSNTTNHPRPLKELVASPVDIDFSNH